MKIRKGFELKNINGRQTVICTDKNNTEYNTTITLSESAAFLWQQTADGGKTKEQLLNLLLEKYDISTVLALNDIDIFVKTLKQNGILED